MINVPALVIVGTCDFSRPPRSAYEMQAGMPDVRLRELRESGHLRHIKEADESPPPYWTSHTTKRWETIHDHHGAA
jgi:pimeloyl-ACP methyl ester carboxylesterase